MKNIFYTMWATLTVGGMLCLGCKDADNSAITENNAYIKNAYEDKTSEVYIDQIMTQTTVPVNVTRKDEANDIKVSLGGSEAALEAYNKRL